MAVADERLREIKDCMGEYLLQKGLPLRRPFRCLNPRHEDVHPSMSYNERAGNVHCFSCGATYDLLDLIGLDYGIADFWEKYARACALFGFEAPRLEYRGSVGSARREEGDRSSSADGCSGELARLRDGARSDASWFLLRGITGESVRRYGLFIRGNRAYFPVTEGGVCSGWSARATVDGVAPRYKNSPGPIGIWNGDLISRRGNGGALFVTEGIADAIVLEQMGYSAVSLCGSQNTAKLLRRCKASASTAASWLFVACGDPDPAGKRMNELLCAQLHALGIGCAELPLAEADGDVNQLYLNDPGRLKELCDGVAAGAAGDDYAATSAAASLDAFFRYSLERAERGGISTGFQRLDRLLDGGFFPGLYILGAISSVGKTGFILQVADSMAQSGEDVLFFSLEQSRFELIARSLSRIAAGLDAPSRRAAVTVRQLLGAAPHRPSGQRLLEQAREAYSKSARSLFFREGIQEIGLPEIRAAVLEQRERRGRAPVVIVDYLQIIRPTDQRATDKQNIDRAVVELKRISRDFDIPVIAVSSFNRENYRTAVSMEAFKESGAVEYSSDVLLGLQLEGAGGRDFDVNRAKSAAPRRVELVLLKNRNGVPYAKIRFRYTAKFGLFEEE